MQAASHPAGVYFAGAFLIFLFSLAGSLFCSAYNLPTNTILLPSVLIFLALYCFVTEPVLLLSKKVFCFFNAAQMGAFCTFYGRFITAPYEIGLDEEPLLTGSSLINVLVFFLLFGIFWSIFHQKILDLLVEERIDRIWRILIFINIILLFLFIYSYPKSAEVVTTGRVRSLSLLIFPFIPCSIFLTYYALWITASQITKNAKLIQENQLLQMEQKRYHAIETYDRQIRILRHDFRQHLLVIDQYAKNGDISSLRDYLQELENVSNIGYTHYCANNAVDAIAAHYTSLAKQSSVEMKWALSLPETLFCEDTEICSVLGNLLENALNAVCELPQEKRIISVTSQLLSESMLGISVENPYIGAVTIGKNGLPVSKKKNHGIGMLSVKSIVDHYHGTLTIQTENGLFSVNILLMKIE